MLSRYGFRFEEKYESDYTETLNASGKRTLVIDLYLVNSGHMTMDTRVTDGFGVHFWIWGSSALAEPSFVTTVTNYAHLLLPSHLDERYRGFSLRRE